MAFFCVVTLLFGFFCRCSGFCHRTESDLFLFLFEYVLLVETNPFLELVVFSGLLTSNISRYFLDFASEASEICKPVSVNFK